MRTRETTHLREIYLRITLKRFSYPTRKFGTQTNRLARNRIFICVSVIETLIVSVHLHAKILKIINVDTDNTLTSFSWPRAERQTISEDISAVLSLSADARASA